MSAENGEVDPAAAAFEAMRQMSGSSGAATTGSAPKRLKRRRRKTVGRTEWSGPGADLARDPNALSAIVAQVVRDQGWTSDVHKGQVLGNWDRLVGATLAAHVRPVGLDGTELTVEAESTAWATQFRLMSRQVVESINSDVGSKVVTAIKVRGPATPSWTRGPRTVRGRGPRDTYG